MFLEPFHHNSSLVTRSVVLLEYSVSSWEDRRHVYVQLAYNDTQILRSIRGLFYHNFWSHSRQENVPKATVHLEDFLSWRGIRRDEWQTMIHPTWQLSYTDSWSSPDVPQPRWDVNVDDADEAHEWVVYCVTINTDIGAYCSTATVEQCDPIHIYLALQCIGLSCEPLSISGFVSANGTISDEFFLW